MQKWEYKTVFVTNDSGSGKRSQLFVFLIDSKEQSKADSSKDTSYSNLQTCPKWENFLTEMGQEGWEILTPIGDIDTRGFRYWYNMPIRFYAIFKRPVSD